MKKTKRWTMSLLLALALALTAGPAAGAQEPELVPPPEDFVPGRCEVRHAIPEGPLRIIEHQMVEAPVGSTTETGVLFLYTDRFTRSQVRTRVAEWVGTANSLFNAGTSGVRLKVAGVQAAPASVSRLDGGDSSSILEEATSLDYRLRSDREATGGDAVIVVADSGVRCGGGVAWVFQKDTVNMRSGAYGVVGMSPTDPGHQCRYYEGYTLAHEVGHLLGLLHDAATIDADAEEDPGRGTSDEWRDSGLMHDSKGFGYVNPEVGGYSDDGEPLYAGTVMSYST